MDLVSRGLTLLPLAMKDRCVSVCVYNRELYVWILFLPVKHHEVSGGPPCAVLWA